MTQWWSWALALVGVTGLWLAGSRRRAGWAVGVGAQVLWVAYALATRQWGFVFSAVAYGIVYTRNWRRWRGPSLEAEVRAVHGLLINWRRAWRREVTRARPR